MAMHSTLRPISLARATTTSLAEEETQEAVLAVAVAAVADLEQIGSQFSSRSNVRALVSLHLRLHPPIISK